MDGELQAMRERVEGLKLPRAGPVERDFEIRQKSLIRRFAGRG